VNFDVSVVADKPQLAKLVHEVANPGSRGPNHFRQGCLTDIRIDRLRTAFLAKICEQQEKSCKPPFTRIEELVDEVLLNPAVPGQEIGHEQLRKFRLFMKSGDHRGFRDGRDQAIFHRRCRRNAQLMPIHAALAEKLAGLQNRDDGFLALFGKDSKLYLAFLYVKHSIGDIALLEHLLAPVEFENRLPGSDFREERLRIELVIGGHGQQAAPLVHGTGCGFRGSLLA
jgi:hypothetical protein